MFETYLFRRWLRRAQRDRRRVVARHRKEVILARSRNCPSDDIERIEADKCMNCELMDDEIAERQTTFLLQQAQKYLLPIPPLIFRGNAENNEHWIRSTVTRKYHLTHAASVEFKKLIAEAEDRDWNRVTRWIPFLSAVTGLMGVAVAILALLKH